MLAFVKTSAVSAVLSFAVVTAYNDTGALAEVPGSGKLYQERVSTESGNALPMIRFASVSGGDNSTGGRKGNRLAASSDACGTRAWPYVAQACLTRENGRPEPSRVRVITVETQHGSNTSLLARVPQADIARR